MILVRFGFPCVLWIRICPPRSRKSSVAFACDRLTPSGGNWKQLERLDWRFEAKAWTCGACFSCGAWEAEAGGAERCLGLRSWAGWNLYGTVFLHWILPDCRPLLALVFLRNLHWVESFILAKTSNHLAGAKTSCSIQEGWCREWRWRFCTFRCLEVAA